MAQALRATVMIEANVGNLGHHKNPESGKGKHIMAYKFEKAVAHFIRFDLEEYPQSIRWTIDGVSWNVVNDPEGSSAEQACKETILSVIKDDSHYQGWVKRTHKQVSAASAFNYVSSWFGDNNITHDTNEEVARTQYVLTLSKPDGGVGRIVDTLLFLAKFSLSVLPFLKSRSSNHKDLLKVPDC